MIECKALYKTFNGKYMDVKRFSAKDKNDALNKADELCPIGMILSAVWRMDDNRRIY